MIGSRKHLEAAFQFGRFPPRGVRGVGGERSVKWGLEWDSYLANANTETMIIPLLETRDSVEHIDSILEVDGLEAVFFGPADMSASFGYLGQWEGSGVAEVILELQAKATSRGISSGILARNSEEAVMRRKQGFRMIGLGADVNLMLHSLQQTLHSLR
jgi:2-keto-3-deoxy-L-rhamnonate aldolase RhmA